MDNQKSVLIIHASAGHGHSKAAMAVWEVACSDPTVRGECIDALGLTRLGFGRRYRAMYLFMIKAVPWFWGLLYYISDIPWVCAVLSPLRAWTNHFFAAALEAKITGADPDIIVNTHFLGAELCSRLKAQGRIRSRLVTVITDYRTHSFWLAGRTDIYAVAAEETAADLVRRRVPRDRIIVTGIPVEAKFSAALSTDAVRARLGLDNKKFSVLLTSGGGGVGVLAELLSEILRVDDSVQVLVVCGTNERLLRRVKAIASDKPQIKVFGFVDNIQELMAASNLVMGKGGGLTITESLCMLKPMILIGAVPGQESRNVRWITRLGAAKYAATPQKAVQQLLVFRRNSEVYREALKKVESLRKPLAAKSIWEHCHG